MQFIVVWEHVELYNSTQDLLFGFGISMYSSAVKFLLAAPITAWRLSLRVAASLTSAEEIDGSILRKES